ncbi:MAG: DUF885 family protein [Thermoanaerobaculia bacterium]
MPPRFDRAITLVSQPLRLSLVALFGAAVFFGALPARGDDLATLSRDFWSFRAGTQPVNRDDIPRLVRPAGWVPDVSPAAIEMRRTALAGFEARYRKLVDPAAPVARQVDYRLVGSALSRVRWELDFTRSYRRDPNFYLDQTLGALVDALLPPPPFDAKRSAEIVGLISSFPKTLEDARKNLDQPVGPFAALAIEDLKGIGLRLKNASDALKPLLDGASASRLDGEIPRAIVALNNYRLWLEVSLPSMTKQSAVGREGYLFFLRNVALIPYSPEELLAMGRQERDRSVAFEVYEARRNQGQPELPLFENQAEQIARAERDQREIRTFLDEKGILTVPAWVKPYGYLAVPLYLEMLAGFGEWTDFTSPLRLAEPSSRYIPRPSPRLGYFALSMAKDPRPDMVHEGIPGHALQLALSWKHDDEIRRHYYDSGVNEGIGFYVEEMMLRMGLWDGAPRSRDMLTSYMRLRALRVEVDVRLALGTFTIDDAARYLETNVPMDAATAKQEAAAFASIPGQAIGYQIGKLQIVKLLAETKRQKGEAFDLRAFHDSLMRNGNVPLSLQRWEMLGMKDEVDALAAGPAGAAR